jgi:hypothetical protein
VNDDGIQEWMNQDELHQLTNKLIDLTSHAGDDHLEDGNEGAGIVDRTSNSVGLKTIETTFAYVGHERDVTATDILLFRCCCAITHCLRKFTFMCKSDSC